VITDPLFFLVAVPAVACLGLSKGGFAGVGMVATPLVALVLPPLQAAALLLPILILQDAISIWVYRRDWDGHNLRIMLPGAVAGVCLAWLLAAHVSDAFIRLAVGFIGIAFVLNAWFGRTPHKGMEPNARSGLFWGGVSGFTSTLSQAGGPPFQVHVLPQRLPKMTLVGTTTMFFAAVNAMKVVPYLALGQFSTRNLATSAVLLPLAVVTNFLGVWVVRQTPTELFYRIAYVLVFIISSALIWQGFPAILHH
jgi:uncharacterized membrane protein YfcA